MKSNIMASQSNYAARDAQSKSSYGDLSLSLTEKELSDFSRM